MGGTSQRMKAFAVYIAKEINLKLPEDNLEDLSASGQRYSMYKVGPILSISVSNCLYLCEKYMLISMVFFLAWNGGFFFKHFIT